MLLELQQTLNLHRLLSSWGVLGEPGAGHGQRSSDLSAPTHVSKKKMTISFFKAVWCGKEIKVPVGFSCGM